MEGEGIKFCSLPKVIHLLKNTEAIINMKSLGDSRPSALFSPKHTPKFIRIGTVQTEQRLLLGQRITGECVCNY